MTGALAFWLDLPRWLRMALMGGVAVLLLGSAVLLYLRHRDNATAAAAVETHERDVTADVNARLANAYNVADTAEQARKLQAQLDARNTQEAIDDATRDHPTEAIAPAGPAARAAADSLRARASAR